MTLTERWLRGPVPDLPIELQPAAHALLQAREDVVDAVSALDAAALGARPGGAASLAWHVFHLAGSTDRLLTYARGEALGHAQKEALERERTGDFPCDAPALLALLHASFDSALDQLRDTDARRLDDSRQVGRMRLPSSVRGLLFHAAEHASRHAGQVVTTAKIVQAERSA